MTESDGDAGIARDAYKAGFVVAMRSIVDCRVCAHFVGIGSPCRSAVQCVDGDKFKRGQPVQQWERKNG